MRVIAGSARRLQLKTIEGKNTRPTTDRIKETLFNILSFDLEGSRFLDLFAGSGGIGIEALSRGASCAAFVENNRKAAACIKENLVHTHLMDKALVLTRDVIGALDYLESREEAYDIIFMDPPYGRQLERETLECLADSRLCKEDTQIIVETDLETDFDYVGDLGFSLVREKTYKTNRHIFLQRKT